MTAPNPRAKACQTYRARRLAAGDAWKHVWMTPDVQADLRTLRERYPMMTVEAIIARALAKLGAEP